MAEIIEFEPRPSPFRSKGNPEGESATVVPFPADRRQAVGEDRSEAAASQGGIAADRAPRD